MMNPIIHQPAPAYVPQAVPTIMSDENEVELSSYLNVLFDNRWLIATIALAVTLLGATYAYLARPVYEANMTVQVQEETQREAKNILGEMGSLFDVKTGASSEMELLKSHTKETQTNNKQQQKNNTHPKKKPEIGKWIADHNKKLSAPGIFGMGGYVWGNEKIDVGAFYVPDAFLNREFVLPAQGNG